MTDPSRPDGSDSVVPGEGVSSGANDATVALPARATPVGTPTAPEAPEAPLTARATGSQPTISGPRPSLRPTPQERANELVQEYLVAAAEDAKKVAAAVPPPAAVNWRLFLAVFMLLGCVAVWTVVLFTRPAKSQVRMACREARQAALKLRVARQAEFVNDYVRQKGSLPPLLDSTQDALLGVAYFKKPDGTYELVGTDRELVSNYRSTWALDSFVGDAPDVISRRCR